MKNRSTGWNISLTFCFLLLANLLEVTRAYAESEQAFATEITINVDDPGKPFRPLLLGSNLEWNNRGDNLLAQNGQDFNSDLLARVLELGPTLLRFPGGTQSDLFDWSKSVGEANQRGSGQLPDGSTQPYLFGVDEFIRLTDLLHAQRLFTVNVVNATPDSTAELARYLSGKGGVAFWEIGNEPYLAASAEEVARLPFGWRRNLTPAEFIERANAAIHALRQVQPKARVGIPLRSDQLNNKAITRYPGYNNVVLDGLKETVDFVSLHTAYMPAAFSGAPDERTLYLAIVAAAATVADDMATTREQLARYFPGRHIPLAFTEYNALVTLGAKQDGLLASLAGALYVADILRMFAQDSDVLFANFWSLADNWHFGAVDRDGNPRPAFYVLRAYRALARGTMDSPQFEAPSVGFATATNVPFVVALPVRKDGKLYVALLNRHEVASAKIHLKATGILIGSGKFSTLSGSECFAGAEGRTAVTWQDTILNLTQPDVIDVELPAHSFNMLEVAFKGSGVNGH